jgi:proteasome lid subunit RPN8/RPN11
MADLSITITPDQEIAIREHGEATYPEECCGFLFGVSEGDARELREVVAIGNERKENRQRRFLIGPEEYRRAEEYANEKGFELLGFYHSHPDHPAIPSEFDREHALPFTSYIIVSIRGGDSAVLRSWQLTEDRESYIEETVNIKQEEIIEE